MSNPREAIAEENVAKENMLNRARDELFSHINRCGVLQAEDDDQRHWMDETIDYLAERYPDLTDGNLQELYSVGIRFCQPAIPHGRKRYGFNTKDLASEPPAPAEASVAEASAAEASAAEAVLVQEEELVSQEAGGENTPQQS